MVIDDYDDGEERGRECEIWKEKRENYNKRVSYERPRLWLCEWNNLGFEFQLIFYVQDEFEYGLRWILISLLPVSYPCFQVR